jgi:hypothetical protein
MDLLGPRLIVVREIKEWRKTMSKKTSNLKLLYIFVGLIVIYGGVKLYQKTFTEKTLKTDLIQIDTAKVTKILLYPVCEERKEIKFVKEGKKWTVSKGNIISETDENTVRELLAMVSVAKTKSLASKDKSKWKEFNLTDSASTRIEIFEGKKETLDLLVGKFSYQASNNPYGDAYGQGGGISGTTFVRESGEDEVYAVEGFLTLSVNRQFNTFRNSAISHFSANNVKKISFKYPGDSSFVLTLKDKKWMMDGQVADSSKVANYINFLSKKSINSFDDSFKPAMSPQCQVTFEGDKASGTIDAYIRGDNDYVINSSTNPKSFFASKYAELYSDVFKNKKDFIVSGKK